MSSSLESTFNKADLETLIEAMGDWELLGNQEYHVLQMVKNIPVPSKEDESHEFVTRLKEHFSSRERDIKSSREFRQEKAVFLKAKLMMARNDLGIEDVFNMASEASKAEANKRAADNEKSQEDVSNAQNGKSDVQERLDTAEFFIKDLGVWKNYQEFLKNR